ncbi:MAG: hypothetical protein IK955_05655 [Clostridia bacterium]|nr:hypothetical protein [Clostridia bacterium]
MKKYKHLVGALVCVVCLSICFTNVFQTSKAARNSDIENSLGCTSLADSETEKTENTVILNTITADKTVNKIENEAEFAEANGSILMHEKDVKKQPANKRKSVVSFAGIVESSIIVGALNKDKIYTDNMQHLPIFRIDTNRDMKQFKSKYCNEIFINEGYDEVPSFEEITSGYDEAFFKSNSLLIVYVEANSGSFRFDASSVYCDGNSVCVYVKQANNPVVCTDDVVGWFITVTMEDSEILDCKYFDAVRNDTE